MLGSSIRSRREREENRNERSSAGTLVVLGMAFAAGYLLGARRGTGGGGEQMRESLETAQEVADTDRQPAEIDIDGQGSAAYEGENVDIQAQREGDEMQADAEYEGDDVEVDAEYDGEGVDVEAESVEGEGDEPATEESETSEDEASPESDDAGGAEDGS